MIDIDGAAKLFLAAREGGDFLLQSLPERCRPATREEALAIQDRVAEARGPRAGWKVGPGGSVAPLFVATTATGTPDHPAILVGPHLRLRIVEGEVAFRMGADLPTRAQPYSRDEVLAAIATAHPAIEVVESRFVERPSDPLLGLADNGNHGAFVHGAGTAAWRDLDFTTLGVSLTQDATGVMQGKGGNPAPDIIELVVWLANEGTARLGGLRAGEFVTTGTYTGVRPAALGSTIGVMFERLGGAAATFASPHFVTN